MTTATAHSAEAVAGIPRPEQPPSQPFDYDDAQHGGAAGAPPLETDRLTLTVEEVGVLLGIGRSLAYSAVRCGEIPSVRVGRRYLVPVSRLNEWLAGRLAS